MYHSFDLIGICPPKKKAIIMLTVVIKNSGTSVPVITQYANVINAIVARINLFVPSGNVIIFFIIGSVSSVKISPPF